MVAGSNVKVNIWRINTPADDSAGGALVSGTLLHQNYPARIQQQKASQLLLQQGLEINKIFTAILVPGTLDIQERDELEVTCPSNYYLVGKRLRIINVRQADFVPTDRRNYMMLTMTRSERSHAQQ